MKNLTTLLLFFFVNVIFAQEINITKNKFYYNNSKISSKEVRKIIVDNPKALALFNGAKEKEIIGGILLGFGIGCVSTDLISGLTTTNKYPTSFTYVGIGCALISIPVLSGRKNKIKKAIDDYNSNYKNTSSENQNFDLNFLTTSNGVGLQLKF